MTSCLQEGCGGRPCEIDIVCGRVCWACGGRRCVCWLGIGFLVVLGLWDGLLFCRWIATRGIETVLFTYGSDDFTSSLKYHM